MEDSINKIRYKVCEQTSRKAPSIGYIVQCMENETFGIIYGAYGRYSGAQLEHNESISLFYFKKEKHVSYKAYTIVSYLQDMYICNNKISKEVSDVIAIDEFQFIDTINSKFCLRKNGHHHTDKGWKLMNCAIPFIEKSYNKFKSSDLEYSIEDCYTICHPQIHHETGIVEYYYSTFSDLLTNIYKSVPSILSCYFIIKELHIYGQTLPMEFLSKELSKIHLYVKKFDIHNEAKKFFSGHSGYFKCCPGSDDMFIMWDYKTTTSKDDFVRSLVVLGVKKDYRSCVGRGIDDEDYDNIDECETKKLRNEVCEKYDKDKHYTFLLKAFIEKIRNNIVRYNSAKNKLYSFINENDKELFNKKFTEENYKATIEIFGRKYHKLICLE